jgi:hypothetical protein
MGMTCRLVGLAVVGALLGASATGAATLGIDLSGSSTLRSTSAFAPSPPGYFETALAPGSSLVLEVDAAGGVTIASGDLRAHSTLTLFAGAGNELTLTSDLAIGLQGGAGQLGALGITWTAPAQQSVSGTILCQGAGCALLQLPDAVIQPYSVVLPIEGFVWLDPVPLGSWSFDGTTLASEPIALAVSTQAPYAWARAVVLHGTAVPEPAAGALVAAALIGLLVRRFA